ncbi:PilW family protein [Photobacterium sp.]|uniref:PilW family protein n=1 Tax=Photobacterium sp. TaxID=660 RepID=UPI00299F4437|nr:prepilin-type N-terminal cleavage/methylation domain-containing protein [Photobacterium sp.]MDX1303798.1 prepilin-type N-terminal cleavage/methylation domain-containing protein [Photobacterium sp.]
MHSSRRSSRGFTLIEMIMALVILGIISVGVGSFLQFGVDGYVSTVDRERLQSEARFVMERISREIRHAAPNSVFEEVIDGHQCLSFYPVYLSAFYLDKPFGKDSSFTFVPFPDEDELDLWTSDKNKVDGFGIAMGYASQKQYSGKYKTLPLVSVKGYATQSTVVGDKGIYRVNYKGELKTQSPAKRLYLYKNKVSFCFEVKADIKQLYRRVNDENPVMLSDKIDSVNFDVNGVGLNSNSVVHLTLRFEDPISGKASSYNHSVQVINVL